MADEDSNSDALTSEETALLDADRANESAPVERGTPEAAEASAEPAEQTAATADGAEPVVEPAEEVKKANAVTQERERRKAAEKDLKVAREEAARNAGRLEAFIAAVQTPQQQVAQPAPPEIPDVNEDPIGHFQAQVAMLQQNNAALADHIRQQEQAGQAQNNVKRLMDITAAHENAYAKEHPEYTDASSFVYNLRDAQLQAMGYSDPAHRAQIITDDVTNIAAAALQSGGNIAERVLQLAQASGWHPAEAPSPAPAERIAAVVAQQQAAPDAQKKLETVARGQEMTQSLGQVPGAAISTQMTAQKLLAMSDEDFAAATSGGNWKKLMENAPKG